MARMLLDENLPRPLKAQFSRHTVSTVRDMQWTGIRNGALVSRAEGLFDVLVTLDRSLRFQQAISGRDIAVVVVRARSNRLQDIEPGVQLIEDAADIAVPGMVSEIDLRDVNPADPSAGVEPA